jgi:hypothetical protein
LDRPDGSTSKLNTIKDGLKVLKTIFLIFKDYRPFLFFFSISILLFVLGLLIGIVPILEFFYTKYITHVPLAILASGTMVFSLIFFSIGVILDTEVKNHRFMYELKLLQYKKDE